jgi:hypothetical protein
LGGVVKTKMKKHNYETIEFYKRKVSKRNRTILVLLIPAFVGGYSITSWFIDYLSTRDWFVPKTVEYLNKSEQPATVSTVAEPDTLPDVTKLSTVTPIGEESETPSTQFSGIEQRIREMFGEDADVMLAIAKAESSLNSIAIHKNSNNTTDCGIFQINVPGDGCPHELFDVNNNINRAKMLYDKRGFQPWVVFNTGAYKRYLN